MSYLGLDIGTGGCKAVVFDREGKELAASFREYPVIHPHPDWAEIDPDEVINKCFEVIIRGKCSNLRSGCFNEYLQPGRSIYTSWKRRTDTGKCDGFI